MQQPIELNLRIRIFPGHIRAATIVLSIIAVTIMIQHGVVLHIIGPFRFLQRVNVVGPFVAPVTELAQFLAIGPDNHVPQTFRMIGLASYAAFFSLANAASRTSMTPYLMAVLQGLPASLQDEAPPTPQQLDELVLVVPMLFMTACLGISTLMLGLDLTGPWNAVRAFHFLSGIAFLIAPAAKYTDLSSWAQATWQGTDISHTTAGVSWMVTALVTTMQNRRRLARRVIADRHLAAQLEITDPVGGRWGQTLRTADSTNDAEAAFLPKLSPRALHFAKSAFAASITLALYGPLLQALDLPAGSPIFLLASLI